MALRCIWSACDSISIDGLAQIHGFLVALLVAERNHGAVQAHAGIGGERGEFAHLAGGVRDVVHVDGIGDVTQRMQHAIEIDRQRVDLVAVDRRGEGLVQQRDQVDLDLVGTLLVVCTS